MEPACKNYYLFYANYDIYTYAVVSVQIVLNINRLHICKYNTKTTLKLPTRNTVPQLQQTFQKMERNCTSWTCHRFRLLSQLERRDGLSHNH